MKNMDQIKGNIIVCVWSDIKHEINEKHKKGYNSAIFSNMY